MMNDERHTLANLPIFRSSFIIHPSSFPRTRFLTREKLDTSTSDINMRHASDLDCSLASAERCLLMYLFGPQTPRGGCEDS
jgi:hypothetical protein